jgi:hypothetical protein
MLSAVCLARRRDVGGNAIVEEVIIKRAEVRKAECGRASMARRRMDSQSGLAGEEEQDGVAERGREREGKALV